MSSRRMPSEEWVKVWIYLNFVLGLTRSSRPRFDTSTDMGMVLVPADAEIESVIFRLRATDQDADFPLVFDITATVSPVVRIENLPCTLYNKICQANVILTKRLTAGRLHDFAVRVRDAKGDSNSMQATISVTNATTQRDKIFPHIPAIIMVPEDAKPGKELDYILVRANQWSGKPVYIELWQPKELFTIRQRQTPTQTRGVITLIGELDFETQSMYTLTLYATDPYTEPKKDTRNIAGLHLVVIVQDVQDVPPIFTHAPPLTKLNNTIQPGDLILRVHAEDGDKGVPREVTYGLVSEGNPFTPFFNISESTGEIILARPLEELTQITHVGAPVVLSVVAEEIRRSPNEPPAQATVVEVGLLLGEPANSPPYFENDNYVAWMDENPEPGSLVIFNEPYSTRVKDEDIGKAGVFALKLENNNGTFEISPTVAEKSASFILSVRDNTLIDYEVHKSLRFKIVAQEVGPATNLSASVPVMIFLRDLNDNPPTFQEATYKVTLSENVTAGTRVVQVHATDKDTGSFGRIQYTRIIGPGSEAFVINPDTGVISVATSANRILDRESTLQLQLTVEARDEDGKGLRGSVPLAINLLDVNDNAPIFEKDSYDFFVNGDLTNFTVPAIIKATDADAEPPNNEVRYELIHGNYENYFFLDEVTGEIFLRKQMTKARTIRHNPYQALASEFRKTIFPSNKGLAKSNSSNILPTAFTINHKNQSNAENGTEKFIRRKRQDTDRNVLFILTARAYDLGVPHLSGTTQVNILQSPSTIARIVMFVVAEENPDPVKTAQTLATITGGHITVKEIRPYVPGSTLNGHETTLPSTDGVKRSIVVARVEPAGGTSLVDIDKIRAALAANGVGVIGGDMQFPNANPRDGGTTINITNTIPSVYSEEVTVYKAENKLLFWLLILLGLLILAAIFALIFCCVCPGCPFYMAPRKRRIHSSETLVARSDGRPKRHIHRKYPMMMQDSNWSEKKQAWSADPMRLHWQFNRRNTKQYGLASLPGDVVRIPDPNYRCPRKAMSLRGDPQIPIPMNDPLYPLRRQEEHRIHMENIVRAREYEAADIDSLRKHEFERESDLGRQPHGPILTRREHHFYREGNAEVMKLVTRDGIEETLTTMHRPPEIIIDQASGHKFDGKDILLRRFIEDQKLRVAGKEYQDCLQDDFERQSMESHQRQHELSMQQQQQQQHQQREILVIPEILEVDHRQHLEQLGPDVQRLIIDHGIYEKPERSEIREHQDILAGATLLIPMEKPLEKSKETSSVNLQTYTMHDLEFATRNVLLTRLLLERDGRVGAGVVDPTSYLETQSLPGQVAAGTQTDQTAATQTEHQTRSRSDNESEEESRIRKKMKFLKRYGEEPTRIRTLWMKSPIEEEERQYSGQRTTISRRKMRDIKDGRTISIEPEVLREISDSLDENPEMPANFRKAPDSSNSQYESREEEAIPKIEDSSSVERKQATHKKGRREKRGEKEEKRKKTTKSRSDTASGPSFRILEKEMNSLSRKLSKLTGRKISSGEDSGEQKKVCCTQPKCETSQFKDYHEELKSRKMESKSERKVIQDASQSVTKQHLNIPDQLVSHKAKQKSKLRKVLPISTASSEWEESTEKSVKKSKPQAEARERQKLELPVGKAVHAKLRRQGKTEMKVAKKSMTEKLTKSEAESVITKLSSSEHDYTITSDKPANIRRGEEVPKTSVDAITEKNKFLISSSSIMHEMEKPKILKEMLPSATEEYSDYGDASASSMREAIIIKSPKRSKSSSRTTDVGTMGLGYSERRSVGSSPDSESITSTRRKQSNAGIQLLLAKPDSTAAISTEMNETQLEKQREEITLPVTESPTRSDRVMKKKSNRKRVKIAEERYEEDGTPFEKLNIETERAEKIQIDRKSRNLRERTPDGDMAFPDQSIISAIKYYGGGESCVKKNSDTTISSPSETSPGKEKPSVTKSPRARSPIIPSVQSIRTTMDGIIEQAKTFVSGTMKAVKTSADDAKDNITGIFEQKMSDEETQVFKKEETMRNAEEDMKTSHSDALERIQIAVENVENTLSVKLEEKLSKLKSEISEEQVTKNMLEKTEHTSSDISEIVQAITMATATPCRTMLDQKMSKLKESDELKEEIAQEETTGDMEIPTESVNSDVMKTLKSGSEDLTNTFHTKIERIVNVKSGMRNFIDSGIQKLTGESGELTDTGYSQSAQSPNAEIEKYLSTIQTETSQSQYKLGIDQPEKPPSIAKPSSKGQSPVSTEGSPNNPIGIDYPTPKQSQALQQRIESTPSLDITVTSYPFDLSGIPIHDNTHIPTKIVDELKPTEDGLEQFESANLETTSIKSGGSQSSKNMIIVRETSFLNSPKRESPKKDDSIATSGKSEKEAKGDTFIVMSEKIQLRRPKSSEMQIPDSDIKAPTPEISTEPSNLKTKGKECERRVSVSKDTFIFTTEEKLQRGTPAPEQSGVKIPDLDIEVLTAEIAGIPLDLKLEGQQRKTEVSESQDTPIFTTENIQTNTPTPESSALPIPDLNIKVPTPEIPTGPPNLELERKVGETAVPVSKELPNLSESSLERFEEDSNISSRCSTQTTFIAQPYGTPRHKKLVRIEHIINDDSLLLPSTSFDVSMDDNIVIETVSFESQVGTKESDSGELEMLKPVEVPPDDIVVNEMEHTGGAVEEENNEIQIQKREFVVTHKQEGPSLEIADKSTTSSDQNKRKEEIKPNQVELISKTLQEILPDDDGSTSDLLPDISQGTTSREVKTSNTQKTFGIIHKMVKAVPTGYLKKNDENSRKVSRKERPTRRESLQKECKDSKISTIKEKQIQKKFPEELATSKPKKTRRQEHKKVLPLETKSRITSDRLKMSRKPERDEEIQPEKFKTEKRGKSIPIIKNKETITSREIPSPLKKVKKNRYTRAKLKIMKKSSSCIEVEKDDRVNTMQMLSDSSRDLPTECDKIIPIFQVENVTMVMTGETAVESVPTPSTVETTASSKNIEHREESTEKKEISVSKTSDATSNILRQLMNSSKQTTGAKKDEKSQQDKRNISSKSGESHPTASKFITDPKSPDLLHGKHLKEDTPEAQSRYMVWYKEMQERRDGEDQEEPPKWLRKSTRQRWLKMSPEDRKHFDLKTPEMTPRPHRKVKPSKNVESEQLKAIVRQGRRLRRAEGGKIEEPQIEIFAPEKPPQPTQPSASTKYHHLIQHSEYKYEKIPPFYLHPPRVPHPSPQISPRHFEDPSGSCSRETRRRDEDMESGIVLSMSTGGRLRHQQLLEKKSVFDIAYSEAAPSQLRADSTTPPS